MDYWKRWCGQWTATKEVFSASEIETSLNSSSPVSGAVMRNEASSSVTVEHKQTISWCGFLFKTCCEPGWRNRNLRFQLKKSDKLSWLSSSDYKTSSFCRVCVVIIRFIEGKSDDQRIGQLLFEAFSWKNTSKTFQMYS